MRKKIVAGNWKMNKTRVEVDAFFDQLLNSNYDGEAELIICPPSIYLNGLPQKSASKNIGVGAQNCHYESFGAYTGEVSSDMLKELDVKYCILGHSERRTYFNESDEEIGKKVSSVLNSGVIPIFCCGEKLDERQSDIHFQVVEEQLSEALFSLDPDEMLKVIIAYEPIWAIGTGVTASPNQAQEMHAHIRKLISNQFGNDLADKISILYGGSCKPDNASELFSCKDIDGGLIGGASLETDSFLAIANSF